MEAKMEKLIEGVRRFQDRIYPQQRDLFERLARGQQPETLVIACSDSRVSLELITQASPGELFVCRNAGNLVPPYGRGDAMAASIEYALTVLPIRDVVICGHSDCGAMKGLLAPQNLTEMPQVQDWLCHARGALSAVQKSRAESHPHEAAAAVARLNVRLQLEHLHTYPQVFSRLREGSLRLHGWLYEIGSGEIQEWEATEGDWIPVRDRAEAAPRRRAAGSQRVRYA
jgi:carbonic anhydrase